MRFDHGEHGEEKPGEEHPGRGPHAPDDCQQEERQAGQQLKVVGADYELLLSVEGAANPANPAEAIKIPNRVTVGFMPRVTDAAGLLARAMIRRP